MENHELYAQPKPPAHSRLTAPRIVGQDAPSQGIGALPGGHLPPAAEGALRVHHPAREADVGAGRVQ